MGESINLKERNEAVKELAKVLANSTHLSVTAGIKTRPRRAEQSHPDKPAFPYVLVEHCTILSESDVERQAEWSRIRDLTEKARLDSSIMHLGLMNIVPPLDPEEEDLKVMGDLVNEINRELKALEARPHSPEPLEPEEERRPEQMHPWDEEQQCPPRGSA